MDQQKSTTHGENTSQNNELTKRRKLDGTPFYIIKQINDNNKEQYFLVMGDYRLTEPTETEKETLEKLITEQWLIITNVIAIATEKLIKEEYKVQIQDY